jgi:glycosyltransferase involved in cell wall biosynthesis
MPRISAIIPVYNGEKTIRETIESVLNQTFSDFEVIVIDDGSTDSTLEIISSLKDSRIKVFTYPNSGQPESRNRGLSHASGEYISFLDADDLWTPDKLEAQYKALQDNPKAAVAYSWTDSIDASGKFFRRGGYRTENGDVYTKLLLNDFIESGSNPLILKQALIEVGGCDKSLTNAHDWDMWLRLAARYHFVVVPKVQILYRVSYNSMSFNVLGQERSSLQVIEQAYAQAPESVQHLKRISLANRYKYLTFKALDGYPTREKGLMALRLFWNAVRNDPVMLRRRISLKVAFKIATVSLLPSPITYQLQTKMKKYFDIFTLFRYIQIDP